MAFIVGDIIRIKNTSHCKKHDDCSMRENDQVGQDFTIVETRTGIHIGVTTYHFTDSRGVHNSAVGHYHVCECPDFSELVRKITTKNNNKNNMTKDLSLIERARILVKGEPEKSLIKKGITSVNDTLTGVGTELFMDFLYRTNKAAFVADPAVAAILAEKDEDK